MKKKWAYIFPGMDPWLEHPCDWPSLHDTLIVHMAEELTRRLMPRYFARPGVRTVVEIPERGTRPDVAVLSRAKVVRDGPPISLADPPVTLPLEPIEVTEDFVEIRTAREDKRVVALVELLSHGNKRADSDARRKYLQKQRGVLRSRVHLVEIDLLRKGLHTVAVPEELLGGLPDHDYRVVVRRADRRDKVDAYPVPLRQRLPRIPIPLLPPDPDAVLDLQALVKEAYEVGAYGPELDYSRPPVPPLDPEDAAWARGLLRRRRARP